MHCPTNQNIIQLNLTKFSQIRFFFSPRKHGPLESAKTWYVFLSLLWLETAPSVLIFLAPGCTNTWFSVNLDQPYLFLVIAHLKMISHFWKCSLVHICIANVAVLVRRASSHENTPYLPGIKLSELIVATTTVTDATEGADIVFVVVPTPFVRGERDSLPNLSKPSQTSFPCEYGDV